MTWLLMWLFLSVYPSSDWALQAEQAYLSGEYQQAIDYYQVGISEGVRSAELYFNLGNSYFELGDIGNSMLFYLRARELDPRDEAIQAGVMRVRAIRRDYQQESTHWGDYLTDMSASFLRIDEMAWMGALAWGYGCLVWGYVLLRRQVRKQRLLLIVNTAFIGILVGVYLLRGYSEIYRPAVVITAPTTAVMSGASQDYLSLYTLSTGAEIRVIERQGGWARLVLPDGSSGWVSRFDFEYISPQ